MERRLFEEIQERLSEVNEVIVKLDPAIRAGAFELFRDYVKNGVHVQTTSGGEQNPQLPSSGDIDLAALLEKHSDGKPSDNAYLLTADWYRRYGSSPFTVESIQQAAGDAGLTIPDRLDKTLSVAAHDGKKLYQAAGDGLYKPTVPGELYLKKTYGVAKGTETPPMGAKS